jgi:hypothetical protein
VYSRVTRVFHGFIELSLRCIFLPLSCLLVSGHVTRFCLFVLLEKTWPAQLIEIQVYMMAVSELSTMVAQYFQAQYFQVMRLITVSHD